MPPPRHWGDGTFPRGDARKPVVNVSWADAEAYAKWTKKRLPTEAEWERAARGTEGITYPWGEVKPTKTHANFRANPDDSARGPLEVGASTDGKSPSGCYDMAGNVWEWTASKYTRYYGCTYESDRYDSDVRVVRGGAFDSAEKDLRCANRWYLDPKEVYSNVGFRCVRDAEAP